MLHATSFFLLFLLFLLSLFYVVLRVRFYNKYIQTVLISVHSTYHI